MRGVFTAGYLAQLEQASDRPLIEMVDLLVGTSTGGIIALGLASGRSAEEMLAFYKEHGPRIFSRARPLPLRLVVPKYSRRPLDRILQSEFGETVMNDLTRPVCVTAHELVEGTTRVIKNDHAEGLSWGGSLPVWKVAAATSAAPTYFSPVQLDNADSHVDGGVWATNPALIGIIEAVRYFRRDLTDIRLLSVGTASATLRTTSHDAAKRMALPHWGRRILHLLQTSSALASDRQSGLLLPSGSYLRVDDELARPVRLDSPRDCMPLEERGRQRARTSLAQVHALLAGD